MLGLVSFFRSRHPPPTHALQPPRCGAAFGEVGRAEGRRPGGVVGVRSDLAGVSFCVLQAPSPECYAF
jgi:hypothetical protein